ncbi:monovalent cation/H+ antiporter subunit D family protein [Sneathiella chinensis]|uniref:Cation:proton antiporter n=1 Tax=Sneathiella chinensis TaxID=349750 RepID=A0ABQ5U4L0_9PROT|nr:monovalent cation/H+ antiporter subunit D family protein [Sneathiella chinensis]GLQ07095.1 cation:proton antiporter [Sneathiella chinensis]
MSLVASHAPVLAIIIPLLAAPVCAMLRGTTFPWFLTTVISALSFAVSVQILLTVSDTGPISYMLGGWAAPWGIEYVADPLSAFVMLIISGISTGVLLYARESIAKEVPPHQLGLFFSAYLLALAGMMGITVTGDAFNIFVFLEITSLSSYVLIAMGEKADRRALTSAFQYLIIGTIGATFILIGVGLLYMMTGTLNIADIASRFDAIADTRPVRAAVAFLIIGIAIKLAMFPFHVWLPNAYSYAPSIVTAFFAGTATKVSVYLLLRFIFTIFGAEFSFGVVSLSELLMPLGVIAFLSMSTVAIFQTNVKRLLAFSSVAQLGYMTVGIALASEAGLTASILHIFNHAIVKTGLFLSVGCMVFVAGSAYLKDLEGIGSRMPLTTFGFVLGGLALIGVPLTPGFVSKWYLVMATLERGDFLGYALTAGMLLSSLLAVIYIWRVVEVAYFRPAPADAEAREAPLSLLIPTWIFIIGSFYFGIQTTVNVGFAEKAASFLMGGL